MLSGVACHEDTLLFLFSVLSDVMLTAEILPSVSVTLTWTLAPSLEVMAASKPSIAAFMAFPLTGFVPDDE